MTDDTPICGNCGHPAQVHPVTDDDGDVSCDEFVSEFYPAADLVKYIVDVTAERDALRADLLSIHGSQDAALPGWAWQPMDRTYVKRTERGDPLVQVKADFTPPYSCDGEHRGNGFRWTSVGVANHGIGYGWSASPAQAMRDADAAISKHAQSKVPHAR